jgi:hypothetical protein
MSNTTGQILRAVGLLIELLGVVAVVGQSRINEVARIPLPGGSAAIGWVAVGAGFLMWITGRIMISGSNRARLGQQQTRPLDDDSG